MDARVLGFLEHVGDFCEQRAGHVVSGILWPVGFESTWLFENPVPSSPVSTKCLAAEAPFLFLLQPVGYQQHVH